MIKMPQMARNGKNQYGEPKEKVQCQKCKEFLRVGKFSLVDKTDISKGRRSCCKSCSAEKAKRERERRANDWKHRPAVAMLNNSKQRAKNSGLEHTLMLENIVIPDYCPVLGIKLETGDRKNHMNAPSIDRLDNSKGYVYDNIIIMSTKANMLKKDATLDELIMIGKWAEAMKDTK
jgi:hypothetical protein